MCADWLGTILLAWMCSGDGVVEELGHRSYKVRNSAYLITRDLGHSCDPFPTEPSSGVVKQPTWTIYVTFFGRITTASHYHPDPEIRWRCESLRHECWMYGKGYTPGMAGENTYYKRKKK
jgi:hypothetical protein